MFLFMKSTIDIIRTGRQVHEGGLMALRDLHRHAEALKREVQALRPVATVEDRFARYRDDPIGFVVDVLGVESATRRSTGEEYQFTVLRDLVEHPRVAVRSGHGSSEDQMHRRLGLAKVVDMAKKEFTLTCVPSGSHCIIHSDREVIS